MGLKEEIRGKVNKVLGNITVKELGLTVYIRELSTGDRIRMTSENSKWPTEMRPIPVLDPKTKKQKNDKKGAPLFEDEDMYNGPKAMLFGAADSNGQRIWGDDDWEDVLAVPQDAMLQIATEVVKLNGGNDEGN